MAKKKAGAVKAPEQEVKNIIREKQKNKEKLEQDRMSDKKKELIDKQRDYRIYVKRRLLKQFELEEMQRQIMKSEGTKNVRPDMLWYGMPYPLKILKASYNLGVEAYSQQLRDEKQAKDELIKKFKLTEKEVEDVLNGKYVKEVRD